MRNLENDTTSKMTNEAAMLRLIIIRKFLQKSGFKYGGEAFCRVAAAIEFKMEDPDRRESFHALYEKVARERNTCIRAVEKSLREAIERAWRERDRIKNSEYNLFEDSVKKPVTAEFISYAADVILYRMIIMPADKKPEGLDMSLAAEKAGAAEKAVAAGAEAMSVNEKEAK